MPKKPSPFRIKKHRIYTIWETAEALGVHRQTVIRWIKGQGLKADKNQKPWLVKGQDIKLFLEERKSCGKCKLSAHHFYCLGCKLPQMPDGRVADYQHQTETNGMLKGLCPCCGGVMNKVVRRSDLEAIRAKIDVTIQQASPRLVSHKEPPLTVTLSNGEETHVKTHVR